MRALSALLAASLLSLAMTAPAPLPGLSSGHDCSCTCCPRGACKCCKRTPRKTGGLALESRYRCGGSCDCAGTLKPQAKILRSLVIAVSLSGWRREPPVREAASPAPHRPEDDPLHQRPPPILLPV